MNFDRRQKVLLYQYNQYSTISNDLFGDLINPTTTEGNQRTAIIQPIFIIPSYKIFDTMIEITCNDRLGKKVSISSVF